MTVAAPPIAVTRPSPGRRGLSRHTKKTLLGLLFVGPAVIFMLVFFLIPIVMTAWMSLHNWPLLGVPSFIGVGNFEKLATDSRFWRSFTFTLSFTGVVTLTTMLVAFPLAMLVEKKRRGVGIYRAIFFLPVVIGMASASFLWFWLVNVDAGIATPLLTALGLIDKPTDMLATFPTAFSTVVLMVTWKTAGFAMILLMTGLQSIPEEIGEAARVDGAGPVSRFFLITLPLMRRPIALTLVLVVAGAMLSFEPFYIILNGGPRNQTVTSVYWIFQQSFGSFKLGYGAALSVVLLVILLSISGLQLRILRANDGAEA